MVKDRFVVGLTGGIGSGKSAAADEFARLGATVVDTDVIAHQLTGPKGQAMPQIEAQFGKSFVTNDGGLDRDKMRARVFSDAASRKALETLLHPMIRKESMRLIRAARGPYVIHVIPLLVESRSHHRKEVDRVLVVDCPEDVQIARVRARSNLPEGQIRAVIAAQASRAERLAAADDIIDNAGTLNALQDKVGVLHARYSRMAETAGA